MPGCWGTPGHAGHDPFNTFFPGVSPLTQRTEKVMCLGSKLHYIHKKILVKKDKLKNKKVNGTRRQADFISPSSQELACPLAAALMPTSPSQDRSHGRLFGLFSLPPGLGDPQVTKRNKDLASEMKALLPRISAMNLLARSKSQKIPHK